MSFKKKQPITIKSLGQLHGKRPIENRIALFLVVLKIAVAIVRYVGMQFCLIFRLLCCFTKFRILQSV